MDYVEMICDLADVDDASEVPGGVDVVPLADVDVDDLYREYVRAFSAGDPEFFPSQSEAERRAFFDTLGLDRAVQDSASHALTTDGGLIGFTYVLPYGDANRHISCMVIRPELQGQGLGKLMLSIAQRRAGADGARTMTLGTETAMRAYHLYRKHGFSVVTV
jgi:ribosomal protein S18 acetylase RimI-like enzyme